MQDTAVETTLRMDDFTKYFEKQRLGKLYFPNGEYLEDYRTYSNFFVNLTDLYKLVSGWKVNHTLVPIGDIIAVIAFGSAVRHPGVEKIPHTRRKYFLFGPDITSVRERPIQPRDADFLIITGENLMREEILEPISRETYDAGTWLKRGGIHIVNRGVNQLLNGVQGNDTISISALREGVPIFFNERFPDVVTRAGVIKTTPRKILWDENSEGLLTGKIR